MIRNWLIGLATAVVAAFVVYGIARATGDDLVVSANGADPAAVAAPFVPVSVILAGLGALLVAWLLKRVPRPRMTWFILAAVVLLLSFVSPFMSAETTATALWLCVMHIAAALPLTWFLSRSLPEVKAAKDTTAVTA